MGTKDQEHLMSLGKMLPQGGRWRWVALAIAVPSIIGAFTALATYSIATVSFMAGVKRAVDLTPVHDVRIVIMDDSLKMATTMVRETRDTLRANGYTFYSDHK